MTYSSAYAPGPSPPRGRGENRSISLRPLAPLGARVVEIESTLPLRARAIEIESNPPLSPLGERGRG